MGRVIATVLGVLAIIGYAVGSGLTVDTGSAWWTGLTRPPWQPPDWVFGVIWPYNFLVLGIAVVRIATRATAATVATTLVLLGLSVVAALTWSVLFYGPHRLWAATVALACATALTVPLVAITFRGSAVLGWSLIPYQVWLALATSLSWGYAVRNR